MRFLSAALLLLLTFDATLKAQIVKPPPVDKVQGINPKAEIVSSSERIVKGAPFSAEAISESVQILFDGNRITQSVKTRLYRDSEGRFRREELPKPVGIGSYMDVPQMIFILDPVASVKFYLNPESKTARQEGFKLEKGDKQKQIEKWKLELRKAELENAEVEQEITDVEREIAKAEQEYEKAEQEYEKARQEFEKRQKQPEYKETEKYRLELENRKEQLGERKAELEGLKEQLEELKQELKKQKKSIEWRKAGPEDWGIPQKKRSSTQTTNQSVTNESSSSNSSSVTENDKPAKEATKSKAVKTEGKTPTNPIQPINPSLPSLPKGDVKTESLGTRSIEGVEAEGVRQTTTVAAGAIGNERPIEIVYERWYSKELELIVFSKYTDPRFGEQSYRLTNIKRDEPGGELFTLPADYKIVTEPEKRITVPGKKPPA